MKHKERQQRKQMSLINKDGAPEFGAPKQRCERLFTNLSVACPRLWQSDEFNLTKLSVRAMRKLKCLWSTGITY
jgi:hypothetical protein